MHKTIFLALTWFIFFGGKPPELNIQTETTNETFKCSLPAPKNVFWTIGSTNYVFFEWDPVPGAAYFRIKIFKSSDNTMIYSKMVTALPRKNGVVINDVIAGNSFYIEVHSICSNGVESPKPSN
ncbi:MAG TPA: hypothetical protein VK168_20505 [Saprospiraceae bacterium]|nr:hypothetical protein [Saprospiraceae bacterium]